MYEYRKLTPKQRAEIVEKRLAKGYPPHSPPHPIRDQFFYLLTAACYEHNLYLKAEERRQQLLNLLFEQFSSRAIELRGWAILPNHYHLLVYLGDARSEDFSPHHQKPRYGADSSLHYEQEQGYQRVGKVLRQVHGATSRQWNLADQAVGRKVWYHYSDRAIRSERHYYTTLNYLHYNSVKHSWSESPYDWMCSSVDWYLKQRGPNWLRDTWMKYPVRDYGEEWDDFLRV
ncbi:MAG: transposase [Leptolyngbyaceae cyanobacterium SM1_1_3]|nr:transposase [Leptolyngbyaceae cyanobacterium SM1_1_3]NJN02666.1 transposase [Leptolyngbyaceae cyanobacterium RM1_1_2]